jgi:hypothetical protein
MTMQSISFPPERKHARPSFTGTVVFEMGVLTKHPELLSEVLGLQQLHDAAASEDRKKEHEQLADDCDMFVQGAQDAKKYLEKMQSAHFEANKRYEQTADVLRSANYELEQLKSEIEDSEGELLTRKQEQQRNSKLETCSQRVGTARATETAALTEVRNAIEKMNEASRAHAAWVYSAQQLKGELKSLEQAA